MFYLPFPFVSQSQQMERCDGSTPGIIRCFVVKMATLYKVQITRT